MAAAMLQGQIMPTQLSLNSSLSIDKDAKHIASIDALQLNNPSHPKCHARLGPVSGEPPIRCTLLYNVRSCIEYRMTVWRIRFTIECLFHVDN